MKAERRKKQASESPEGGFRKKETGHAVDRMTGGGNNG